MLYYRSNKLGVWQRHKIRALADAAMLKTKRVVVLCFASEKKKKEKSKSLSGFKINRIRDSRNVERG
jgi:hypothetical protein